MGWGDSYGKCQYHWIKTKKLSHKLLMSDQNLIGTSHK